MKMKPTPKYLVLSIAGIVSAHVAGAADKVDFAKEIKPILEKTCVQCHGPEKQKGKLRLDTRDATFKGGEDGAVLKPSDADKSDFFRRVALPEDNDDVMPPKGKADHLTAAQIDLVKRWINEGATWPEGVAVAATTGGAAAPKAEAKVDAAKLAGPAPSPAEVKAVAELAKLGVDARPIAAGVNWRYANFRTAGSKFPPQTFTLLKNITNMQELNLAGVQLKDDDLANLTALKNLTTLHLEHTPVTDAGLAHLSKLENLAYLNLFDTAVTDAGLKNLTGLKNLKALYLYQTKVTDQGAAELQKALPNLHINRGVDIKELVKQEPAAAPKAAEPAKPQPPANKPAEPPKPAAPDAKKPAEPPTQPASTSPAKPEAGKK
jgi:mono/diheme cytochrome c family protein